MNKKFFLSLLISAIAIGALLYQFDINEFAKLRDKWNPYFLIPMVASNMFGIILFSLRWYFLLDRKISFFSSALIATIGLGGNMILPARGGDILRIYYTKKASEIKYPTILSQLFLEKVIDLTIVLFIGALSFMLLGLGNENANPKAMMVSALAVFGMILGLIMIRFANERIAKIGLFFFNLVQKPELFNEKIKPHLSELKDFLTWKKLTIPLLITVPTWILAYAVTYCIQSYLIGIPLSFTQSMFMVFCGAMGVAIPSAPSGLGVFHASIVSGFVLIGLGSTDGFLYATAVHMLQFLVLSLFGLIAYIIWMNRKESILKDELFDSLQ
ncbi:lysylphosphatidylglycerol synthase transmembrane domain-containing protein [Leptospira sp. GIMC2001]|uniref:lysylphosphatidylglycerol synthase transmembrane domain-containing protein n=1 Tax=Leptospira sp. GIMC2001 TaxID=1513297 RepID=UPI002349DB77|nr:lysylphosphatidylglycerol synthase transmembrane domain-containing protein [Leptospira sp. GIMC2001]WCL48118.1 lysylphosphatidylglycerol synthase transmembrane domain-containing protein [Leptospira sp. GIMC2001]